jgi:hypothetical protein
MGATRLCWSRSSSHWFVELGKHPEAEIGLFIKLGRPVLDGNCVGCGFLSTRGLCHAAIVCCAAVVEVL